MAHIAVEAILNVADLERHDVNFDMIRMEGKTRFSYLVQIMPRLSARFIYIYSLLLYSLLFFTIPNYTSFRQNGRFFERYQTCEWACFGQGIFSSTNAYRS